VPSDRPQHFKLGENSFSQLLIVRGVSDIRRIEIHTAEPLIPEPSPFEVEIVIAKFKCINS
jgi:hypothetical protein